MPKPVTIPLKEPIESHHGLVKEIVVRPPTWGDVMGTGSPYTVHFDKEGKPFLVYDEAALAHYCDVLVVEPKNKLILEGEVGLADTMAVREAVVNFFLAAAGAGGGSKTSRKNSSSTSDGDQTQSAA